MFISFNVSGAERKRLAQALGEHLHAEVEYLGAPGFAYRIGDGFVIDKSGTLSCPETMVQEELSAMFEALRERGFSSADTKANSETNGTSDAINATFVEEKVATEEKQSDEPIAATTDEAVSGIEDAKGGRFAVCLPRETFADDVIERLKQIVANKALLFKRALGTEELPITLTDKEIAFPWFGLIGADGEKEAYAQFIAALCRMAREQMRVLDKPYDGDNDRFAMRIFMVRLGMKGAQYAVARRLLLKNLSGNSGWRYGAPPKKNVAAELSLEAEDAEAKETSDHNEVEEIETHEAKAD